MLWIHTIQEFLVWQGQTILSNHVAVAHWWSFRLVSITMAGHSWAVFSSPRLVVLYRGWNPTHVIIRDYFISHSKESRHQITRISHGSCHWWVWFTGPCSHRELAPSWVTWGSNEKNDDGLTVSWEMFEVFPVNLAPKKKGSGSILVVNFWVFIFCLLFL